MYEIVKLLPLVVLFYLVAIRLCLGAKVSNQVKIQHNLADIEIPEEPILVIDGDNLDECIEKYYTLLDNGTFSRVTKQYRNAA